MKEGLAAILFDVDNDDSMELIEAEFGITGFGVIHKLWKKMAKDHGYYVEFTEDVALLFARKINVGYNTVLEIVKAALRRGIFDKGLYDKYSILTSKERQEAFFIGAKRWKKINLINEYLLVSATDIPINAYISSLNVDILKENVYIPETTNGMETNRNELNGKESSAPLTQKEYKALSSEFGEDTVKGYIEHFNSYCKEKRKRYDNPASTIRSWILKDKTKDKPKKSNKFCNYTDTNEIDYEAYREQTLNEMLEG